MGPRSPFTPAFLGLRIIVLSATVVCVFFFWKANPIKLFKKKIFINAAKFCRIGKCKIKQVNVMKTKKEILAMYFITMTFSA